MSRFKRVTVADTTARLYLTPTPLGLVEHTDDGDGPALLALHGGMGGYDQSLLLALCLLGASHRHRVLALSRPGYLGTPLPTDRGPAAGADLYAVLLDRLGIGRAVVAAVSAGGPSAIAFATRYPDRCAGLVLVSCASGALAVPDIAVRRLRQFRAATRLPGVAKLLGWLANRQPETSAARSIADPDVLARTLAHPEAGPLMLVLQGSVFTRLAARLPGTIADTEGFAALAPLPIANILAPTLVIHGTGDRVVPFAHGERVARCVPGAEFFAVPEGEHVALFTHLDEVRRRVAAFLDRLDA